MATSPLDRIWRDHWGVHALTPVVTADVGVLRSRLLDLITANPSDPLACNLSDDAGRWIPVAEEFRAAHVNSVIVASTDLDDAADPYAVMPVNRPPDDYRAPFRMVVGRRSVLLYVNHVVGDASLMTLLGSRLVRGQMVSLSDVGRRVGVRHLLRMAARQSGRHWREWIGRRRAVRALWAAERAYAENRELETESAASTVSVGVVLDADRYREFKVWRAANGAGVSITALMAAAAFRAFRSEGVAVADDGLYVLVDLRRYLSPENSCLTGNLAVSVMLPTDLTDADTISRDLRALLNSAQAVPTVLKAIGIQCISVFKRTAAKGPEVRPGRVRMTFNSMLGNPGTDDIPWRDRSQARYLGMSYPIAAGGLSVFACVVDDRMEFSASFRSDLIDRETAQRALNRLMDMPALLSATV